MAKATWREIKMLQFVRDGGDGYRPHGVGPETLRSLLQKDWIRTENGRRILTPTGRRALDRAKK